MEGERKDKGRKCWNKMNLHKLKACVWSKGKRQVKNESLRFHFRLRRPEFAAWRSDEACAYTIRFEMQPFKQRLSDFSNTLVMFWGITTFGRLVGFEARARLRPWDHHSLENPCEQYLTGNRNQPPSPKSGGAPAGLAHPLPNRDARAA